jgi:universal stress protein E
MRKLSKILVAVGDPRRARHPAIAHAAAIAAGSGAAIELFHDLAMPMPLELTRTPEYSLRREARTIRRSMLERLEALAAPLRSAGLKVSVSAVWDFPPFEAVIRRAVASGADLVVAHRRGHHRMPSLLGQTDWELLRNCPVPVLLTRSALPRRRSRVVAAVDPTHAGDKPASLDAAVLRAGMMTATALRHPLHLLHALAPWMREDRSTRERVARLARAAALPKTRVHFVKGAPALALPRGARRLRAGVVVLGCVSRRGLKHFFLGDTAEQVLDDLHCDVLVVKPAGFRSDISSRRRGFYFVPPFPAA